MSLTTVKRGARAASRRRSAGGGAVAFRTTARGNDENTGNDSTCPITVPGTVANGDVMLVAAGQNGSGQTFTISGGGSGVTWSTKQSGIATSDGTLKTYLFEARATAGSAGSTITITSTASKRFPGLLYVASGVTDTGIVTANTVVNTSGTAHAFPSVTVPTAGSLLIGLAVLRVSTTTPPTLAGGAPAGTTLDDESNSAAPSQPNLTVAGLHKTATVGTGAQTPGTATSALACKSVLFTIALAPA